MLDNESDNPDFIHVQLDPTLLNPLMTEFDPDRPVLIRADGTWEPTRLDIDGKVSYDSMKQLIGCDYLQRYMINLGYGLSSPKWHLLVVMDEEGHLNKRPGNLLATLLTGQIIAGNVIVGLPSKIDL